MYRTNDNFERYCENFHNIDKIPEKAIKYSEKIYGIIVHSAYPYIETRGIWDENTTVRDVINLYHTTKDFNFGNLRIYSPNGKINYYVRFIEEPQEIINKAIDVVMKDHPEYGTLKIVNIAIFNDWNAADIDVILEGGHGEYFVEPEDKSLDFMIKS